MHYTIRAIELSGKMRLTSEHTARFVTKFLNKYLLLPGTNIKKQNHVKTLLYKFFKHSK